jgi:polyisoprenoid-binding protein YceI
VALRALLLLVAWAVLPATARGEASVQSIQSDQSHASFVIPMRLLASTVARFDSVQGELVRRDDGQLQVEVRVDARVLTVHGPRWMDRVSRSRQFLDVERHPQIRFSSQPFPAALMRAGGPLQGRLFLRGIDRPVQLQLAPLRCRQPGHDCAIDVEGEVSRRQFGMTAYRFAVRDGVGVSIRVHLAADPTQ